MGRFAAREAPTVDALVADAVAKIGAEIEALRVPDLAGVVLGGGYGRGEGGVFAEGGAERLSNDLDFFAVTVPGASAGALRAVAGALAPIGEAWTARLGVDVDFVVRTPWRIKHDEARVMIQELVRGHVDVAGRPGAELFKDIVRRPPEDLPWTEAVRLLVNRGVGLVLARASADETFVERNVNKCVLGAGDAVLIARHAYAWRVEERAAALGWPAYDAAVEWKFRPKKGGTCTWEESRALWLKAEEEVRAAGRRSGADGRSLYQAARWIVRRRTVGDLRTLGRGPVVRILAGLKGVVEAGASLPDSLRKDWMVFN